MSTKKDKRRLRIKGNGRLRELAASITAWGARGIGIRLSRCIRGGRWVCGFGRGHVGQLLWFGTDISIKTGVEGVSGEILEIPIDFHERDRE